MITQSDMHECDVTLDHGDVQKGDDANRFNQHIPINE